MDLELQQIEAPVGGYYLDILATDLNSNRPVIVENQLEATDHVHLGQLLTYAAGFDAETVVWVTREFRDEHRQALDWLNLRTGEGSRFFGVVVELWKIGNSLPAPHFKLVAAPNGWHKKGSAKPPLDSERSKLYRDFFQSLVDILRDDYEFTNTLRVGPNTRNWWAFPSGYSGVSYRPSIGLKQARVDVYVDSGDEVGNKRIFDGLIENRREIEDDLNEILDWQRLDNRKACRIALIWPGIVQEDNVTLE